MPEPLIKYPFNGAFQAKILALLIRDPLFLPNYGNVVEPGYFDNPLFVILCRKIRTYYDKYRSIPTESALRQLVSEDSRSIPLLSKLLDDIYTCELSDSTFVQDRVIEFAQTQAMRRALDMSRAFLDSGDREAIRTEIDKAMLVGSNQSNLGVDYFATHDSRLSYLSQDTRDATRIPTLIDGLDKVLQGGITRGELNLVMAPSGNGKSIFLINMAYAALFSKFKVLFVTLEMSDTKIGLRLDSRFTGIPMNEMQENPKKVQSHLALFKERSGKLIVKQYPSTTAGVDDIRSLIINLQRQSNFLPDLLIVDYLDIMKPMFKAHAENPYLAQGEVAKALRGLAGEFNMGLWSATQTNKGALGKDIIDKGDKAESWRVIMDSDVVIGLMRNKEDYETRRGRLSFAKMRDGDVEPGQEVVNVRMDFRKMLIASLIPEAPC